MCVCCLCGQWAFRYLSAHVCTHRLAPVFAHMWDMKLTLCGLHPFYFWCRISTWTWHSPLYLIGLASVMCLRLPSASHTGEHCQASLLAWVQGLEHKFSSLHVKRFNYSAIICPSSWSLNTKSYYDDTSNSFLQLRYYVHFLCYLHYFGFAIG